MFVDCIIVPGFAPEAQWRLAGGEAKRNHRKAAVEDSRPEGAQEESASYADPASLQDAPSDG